MIDPADHLSLAHSVAWRFARKTGMPFDELESHAILGLVQAAHGFDEDRGVAFSTYAVPRIRGAVIDGIRSRPGYSRRTKRCLGEEVCIDDVERELPRVKRFSSQVESQIDCDLILRRMENQGDRDVLALYFLHGWKLWEIADLLGVTESRVSQVKTKAINDLRMRYEAA